MLMIHNWIGLSFFSEINKRTHLLVIRKIVYFFCSFVFLSLFLYPSSHYLQNHLVFLSRHRLSHKVRGIKLPSHNKLAKSTVQKVIKAKTYGIAVDSGESTEPHKSPARPPPVPKEWLHAGERSGFSQGQTPPPVPSPILSVLLQLVQLRRDTGSPYGLCNWESICFAWSVLLPWAMSIISAQYL